MFRAFVYTFNAEKHTQLPTQVKTTTVKAKHNAVVYIYSTLTDTLNKTQQLSVWKTTIVTSNIMNNVTCRACGPTLDLRLRTFVYFLLVLRMQYTVNQK